MGTEHWARLSADVYCGLRRGAWYRVLFSTADLVAVAGCRENVLVPREFLEIVNHRPAIWTVVFHTGDSMSFPPDSGRLYTVCPNCSERQVPAGRPATLRCRRCNGLFKVAWHVAITAGRIQAEHFTYAD